MCARFWFKILNGKDHTEDLVVDGRTTLKWILMEYDGRVWNGVIWLRIGNGCGLL
jgi:hypothetical protein